MAFSYQFDNLKNHDSKTFNTQQNAACGIIEYIFNKTDMNDFKDMFFRDYETIAFKKTCDITDQDKKYYYEKTVKYKQQEFKISRQKWDGPAFWFFRIFVCYDMEAVKKNIDAIHCYEDLERYKNGLFDIKHLNPLDKKKRKQLEETLEKIRDNSKAISEIAECRTEENLRFCDEGVVKVSKIVDILAGENGFFPSENENMKEILVERYKKMRENYFKIDWNDSDWTQIDPRSNSEVLKIVPQNRDYDAALLQVPGEYCYQADTRDWKEKLFKTYDNIGHDMPVWLYYQNDPQNRSLSQRPRVMIVSQDPLRSGYGINDILLLSTPWAHHSLKFLKNSDSARLKALKIIHGFLKKGAIIYLTDVHKLYWTLHGKKLKDLEGLDKKESDQNKKIVLERQICDFKKMIQELKQSRKKYLDEEIMLFQPDIIISLGDQAADVLTGSWSKHKDTVYQNRIYVKYHPGARHSDNPRGNDPTYWLRTGNGENDSFII